MAIDIPAQRRPPNTVDMVRITFRHRARQNPLFVVVEYTELNEWFSHSEEYRFSFEAEFIGSSEIGRA
jgi:hypothetical protein